MIQLNKFKLEQLAMVEGESLVDTPKHWVKPNIHIESDYAFGAMQQKTSDKTTYWEKDKRYTSQTNYPLNHPRCIPLLIFVANECGTLRKPIFKITGQICWQNQTHIYIYIVEEITWAVFKVQAFLPTGASLLSADSHSRAFHGMVSGDMYIYIYIFKQA